MHSLDLKAKLGSEIQVNMEEKEEKKKRVYKEVYERCTQLSVSLGTCISKGNRNIVETIDNSDSNSTVALANNLKDLYKNNPYITVTYGA